MQLRWGVHAAFTACVFDWLDLRSPAKAAVGSRVPIAISGAKSNVPRRNADAVRPRTLIVPDPMPQKTRRKQSSKLSGFARVRAAGCRTDHRESAAIRSTDLHSFPTRRSSERALDRA